MDETLLAQFVKAGMPAAALEQALEPLLDKKAERAAIDQDQQRLRENMKTLRGSSSDACVWR